MSSGARNIQINTAERAISTDINRLQALAQRALMELLRYSLDVNAGSDDLQAAGSTLENVTLNAPLTAEIIAGLCVVPAVGSLALGITSGLMLAVQPDQVGNPDDSVYKYVRDVGGTPQWESLAMSAGDPTDPRVDVIECQPVEDPNPEEDNRDVFNPTTGLFTASTVQKTEGYVLTYRVRLGTPGSGFPGVVQGWLPLAVASVPATAASNDVITFWDVRPLVDDRIFGTSPVSVNLPRRTKLLYSLSLGTGTQCVAAGVAEGCEGTRRLGGQLRRGSPGTDFDQAWVDFSDPANQEQGFATTDGIAYIYLVTPFLLPRWARYTDAASGVRQPRSPRGIPIVSRIAPIHVFGTAKSAIVFPTSFGFGGSASVLKGLCVGATTVAGGFLLSQVTADRETSAGLPPASVTAAYSGGVGTVELVEGTHFPAGVTKLRIQLTAVTNFVYTGTTTGVATITPEILLAVSGQLETDPSTPVVTSKEINPYGPNTTESLGWEIQWTFDAVLPNAYPAPELVTYQLQASLGTLPSQMTVTDLTAQVVGWTYE